MCCIKCPIIQGSFSGISVCYHEHIKLGDASTARYRRKSSSSKLKLLNKGWLSVESNLIFVNNIVEDPQNFITMPLGRPIGGLNDLPCLEFWFVLFWVLIHVCLCFVLLVCLWVWVDVLQCVRGGQRTDKIRCQSPPSTLSQPFVGQPCTKQTTFQTLWEHPACFRCLTARGWDCTHQR